MSLYTVSTGGIIQAQDVDQLVNWLKGFAYNVKDYGAKGDGATDDSTAIGSARSDANAAGGGIVFYPVGTYLSGNQPLYPNVHDVGAGIGVTIIKLKSGANTDLFSGQTGLINLSAAANSGSVGTLSGFSLRDMTLDGNQANQTSGTSYPLRFYGYGFVLRNLEVKNGRSGGVLIDWNGGSYITQPSAEMDGDLEIVKIHDNTGIGLQMGGPHDSRLKGVLSWANTSHGFHFAPNAAGILLVDCHPYLLTQAVGAVSMLIEAQGIGLTNCMIEGSDTTQVAILANDVSVIGGIIFGNVGYAGVGIQLGQLAGDTVIPGQILQSAGTATANVASGCNINTKIQSCTSGAMNFKNEANNVVRVRNYQTSGTFLASGSSFPAPSDFIELQQNGLTSDHTINTTSAFWFGGDNNNLFRFYNLSGTDVFNVDPVNKNISFPNSPAVGVYSDNYTTLKIQFQGWNGNIVAQGSVQISGASTMYSGTGAPSNTNGVNGDYYFRTDTPGTANQRIYVKSAGAWVGIV